MIEQALTDAINHMHCKDRSDLFLDICDGKIERQFCAKLRNHINKRNEFRAKCEYSRTDLRVENDIGSCLIEFKQYFDFDCARSLYNRFNGISSDLQADERKISKLQNLGRSSFPFYSVMLIAELKFQTANIQEKLRTYNRIFSKYKAEFLAGERAASRNGITLSEAVTKFMIESRANTNIDPHCEQTLFLGDKDGCAVFLRCFIYRYPIKYETKQCRMNSNS